MLSLGGHLDEERDAPLIPPPDDAPAPERAPVRLPRLRAVATTTFAVNSASAGASFRALDALEEIAAPEPSCVGEDIPWSCRAGGGVPFRAPHSWS